MRANGRLRLLLAPFLCLALVIGTILVNPGVAKADPGCVNAGAYVLFARGATAPLDSAPALEFKNDITSQLSGNSVPSAWAELGNLDNVYKVDPANGNHIPDESNEYPASAIGFNTEYWNSVAIGTNELVTNLNHRYGTDTGPWVSNCRKEVAILGGYSEGANVVGDALNSPTLSAAARSHIAAVALYGDTRYACDTARWSAINCTWVSQGLMGERIPYIPQGMIGRAMSWCDPGDGFCNGYGYQGNHDSIYHQKWMALSANWVGLRTMIRLGDLGISPYDYMVLRFQYLQQLGLITLPSTPPPPPVITHVKRTLAPDGTAHEVYASTMSSVTEAWWRPGGDGVHTDEIINIAQGNIVGFDKVNEPDRVTQSLYTAVPDGVWETWWRAGVSPQSAKIVTGLNGVRQVIAAPTMINGQYTHRLYLLAEDGPHEFWWRDGGDGIHASLLNNISGPVTMAKSTGPDGVDQLYVATPTWVYELWWWPGQGVHYGPIINITQGDIRSLSKGANLSDGGQLLYTGTSTTAWQSYWNSTNGTPVSHGTIATGQTNAIQIEKDVYNGVHELYLATGDHVQEYWWSGPNSGGGELIRIGQNNITSFDKSDDGNFQQIYTASGDLVYETYWAAGVSPTSNVLFSVTR